MKEWIIPALCGFGTGILSSWGIGGGTLLLLIMTLFLGVDHAEARGINLIYFLPTAGISLIAHHKNGYLDRDAIRNAAPVGILCALGAALFGTVTDMGLLRKAFALFLLYAGSSMLTESFRKKDA